MDGLIEISTLPEAEVLVTAIVGMIGIRPTVEAIKAGKDIALANKETLGYGRSYHYAAGKKAWGKDSSSGQRTQCHFPVSER